MKNSRTITLHIGKALPHGNAQATKQIIALWQEINGYLKNREFTAQGVVNASAMSYTISLDAGGLISAMDNARTQHNTFDEYRDAHVHEAAKKLDASLSLTISSKEAELGELESYRVATVFLQQLMLAANLALPGSMQLLDAHFTSAGGHRYEAQAFDSKVFFGARKIAASNAWPKTISAAFEKVWSWLEHCELSNRNTAIKHINKVLVTLLKVAELRSEYSARTVMLLMYQLEILLDCRNASSLVPLRQRLAMVLGKIPDDADCFQELLDIRQNLFVGNQPVHRPSLICHNTADEFGEKIGEHNSLVELATAMVLALLHDLLEHQAQSFEFPETLVRK